MGQFRQFVISDVRAHSLALTPRSRHDANEGLARLDALRQQSRSSGDPVMLEHFEISHSMAMTCPAARG